VKTNKESEPIAGTASRFHWLVYRTTVYRTTWKLRLGVVGLLVILGAATRAWWVPAIGWGLVTDSGPCKPDLIVVDNLDRDYLVFEKAGELKKIDGARVVLVPVKAYGDDSREPDLVPREIAKVMIRAARLQSPVLLPIREVEPITLHAALQVRRFVKSKPAIRSVLVVTDGFRSRRTQLIYSHVLGKMGVAVFTCPVWGAQRPENWASTWHGRQTVFLQYLKLSYYKIVVF
jgi:hypothetical protein